jgi:hypothetical protein
MDDDEDDDNFHSCNRVILPVGVHCSTDSIPTAPQSQLPFSQALPIHPSYSILNVAIDYVMTAPTPFEWMEFEKMASTSRSAGHTRSFPTRVPVIRIFGPLLKHTTNTTSSRTSSTTTPMDAKRPKRRNIVPRQSGCIHIHNVFPYFLARPQFCMFSLASSQTNNLYNNPDARQDDQDDDPCEALDLFRSTAALHIDWDNYESIESSLYTLKHYLELSCIDVYLANRTTNNITHGSSKEPTPNSTPEFIRDISIWYVND